LTEVNGPAVGHQVLCVTHLPQLAGYGDRHFKVEKQVTTSGSLEDAGERTVTRVYTLEGDERVEELAQMLGVVSDTTRGSAREILEQVVKSKSA
jgi:DNA repair protein RecN (Recombination protein N)